MVEYFGDDARIFHGRGHYVIKKGKWAGNTFIGKFEKGERIGEGKYKWGNDHELEGIWKNDALFGYAKYKWPSGDSYTTTYFDGIERGYGTYRWADGSMYIGGWNGEHMQGFGVYVYEEGDRYEGGFEGSKFHGFGVHFQKNGQAELTEHDAGKLVALSTGIYRFYVVSIVR